MRLFVVLNPSSHDFEAQRRFPALERKLRAAATELEVMETAPSAELTRARILAGLEKGPDRVISIGGDGTFHTLVNAMLESKPSRLPEVAVVPFGTANDVAKSLRLPTELDALAAIATGPKTRSIDIGLVRAKGDEGLRSAFFVDSVGIGMDADVLATRERHRGLGGYLAYAAAMAERALVASKFDARIIVDGEKYDDRVFNVIVNNSPVYAGEITMPRSHFDDGLLDVYVFDRAEYTSKLLTFAVKQADLLKLGVDELLDDITENQRESHGRDITIRLASPKRVQVDGELFGLADELFCTIGATVSVAVR